MLRWVSLKFSRRLVGAFFLLMVLSGMAALRLAAGVPSEGVWPTLLALACAAAVFSVWAARSMSRPLENISRVASRLAAGDYEARVRDMPSDDFGRLGETLNALAQRVQVTVTELSAEKAQLAAVLSNMVEGVIAVDGEGRILVINPALCRLLGIAPDSARGRPLVEVLRHREIGSFLENARQTRCAQAGEARLFTPEERVFEVHALPMTEDGGMGGAVAVLHDVTRVRRLEQVRRDFVANVSHELRTPLVSIKGFAETLKSGALDDRTHRLEFLDTIEIEADRMSRLVDDLLELSAIESGQRRPAPEPTDLMDLAGEVAEAIRQLAERRKIAIAVRKAPGAASVLVDPGQLRQVLTNLMVNAVKFNKEGGSVEVSCARRGAMLEISVRDTGMGIPREDLPRIFERFYRVDKARSRELGGTGLGLAIVKHIIEAHGGSVSIESVEDEGSVFRFTLPAA